MASRLAGARSAYLRSATHQPVDWYPWGAEAFARARREDRPILLDIGAVWCHWCHVMDRESYEDPGIAALLAEEWVCIKVDRDERPDVDARYQRAVQAITRQGGWPLTAFLTPDGEVFYGGTYLPPDSRQGRPGFGAVLRELARAFREERAKITEQTALIRRHLEEHAVESRPGTLPPDLLRRAADAMARVFDFQHGGFGAQPKFPHPAACQVLLHRWFDAGERWPREMVDRTLIAMARGGVFDQVGGGFHRYAVDARWIVPHFEKMAHDNSELLRLYVRAAGSVPPEADRRTDGFPETDPGGTAALYRRTIASTTDWVMTVLADPLGGYYASQDADVGLDDDGNYFTWTVDEVRAATGPREFEALVRRFDVEDQGEMPHDPRRNVLWVRQSYREIGAALGVPESEAETAVRSGLEKLRAARLRRPVPFVDTTVYVGWSAMMASAMLEAGALLEARGLDAHALRSLERLCREGSDGSGGVRHALGGDVTGLLEDQVHLADACVTAFESTGTPTWLTRATDLMDHVWAHFRADGGGLYDRAASGGEGFLTHRLRPVVDAPTPSPNGVAAQVCARLAEHTGNERWRARLEELLTAFGGGLDDLGLHGASLLLAADWALNPAAHLVVVAGDDAPGRALRQAARAGFRPRKVLTLLAPGADPAGLPAPVRAVLDGASPRAYLCVGTACRPPLSSPAELLEALETP